MSKLGWVAAAAVAGVVSAGASADATAADVFAVHGVPGDDLGLDPALPVDIAVNGECVVPGLPFGEVAGPLALDPGLYTVEIFLADDASEDCAGPLAITDTFSLGITDTAAVVAHLDVNRDATVTKFTISDQPVGDGDARVSVYHTAAAPAVDVRLKDAHTGKRVGAITDLTNGGQSFPAEVQAGQYEVLVSPSPARQVRFLPPVAEIPVTFMAGDVYAVFAVGSLEASTFQVIPVVITP